MLPLKKILCPTDFSDPSLAALEAANELAVHFSSELIVLHIITPIPVLGAEALMPGNFDVAAYQKQMELNAHKNLEDLVRKKISEGVSVRTLVVLGNPADEIVKTADEEKADLIVIATRGQTGLKRLVFGSVAEKTVRLASQPVLTIQAPEGD
ncbi:MAG: universal stress protein [Deltaproteobacteria bacterium]|nr:universal stress protein [Deltaproteobacteria bacterium]